MANPQPLFRLICPPTAFDAAAPGWATDMLTDGEVALELEGCEIEAINAAAHAFGYRTVRVLRIETSQAAKDETIITHADALPLIWIAPAFSDRIRRWAQERGPMTLLLEADGPLPEPELGRLTRFVALLARQID